MAESNSSKDVIYIDVDDEITGIIEKLHGSKHQIVALVLPKRATMLQSIVNMKLLKRTADEAKKHVVLITGEEGLMPLAGSVGMHVARSLQSKPEIPSAPPQTDNKVEDIEEPLDMDKADDTKPLDKTKTVGELSGAAIADGAAEADGTIKMDDELDSDKPDEGTKKGKHGSKNKKLKVPNFDKFRVLIVVGGLALVIFIALIYVGLEILPKATITIKTNSQSVNSTLQVTLNTTASSVNPGAEITPAQVAQTQKTYTATVNTTGQQNNGQSATGTVTMTAQECNGNGFPQPIPSGSGLSENGLTFITQQSTTFSSKGISYSNGCFYYTAESVTPVTAQSAGSKYNTSSANFAVSGRSDVSGTGSAAGGTDDIVTIVSQTDINNATSKITTDNNAIKQQLESDLESEGLFPIPATFAAGTPNTTDSAAVGSPANQVTVTQSYTYTMYGAKQNDLQAIIGNSVDSQIDTSKQKILSYGLPSAVFSVISSSTGSDVVNMQVTSIAGSALNVSTIKTQVAGQKPGSAKSTIEGYPGVTNVNVKLSPFWVSSIPKKTSKISVKIDNP